LVGRVEGITGGTVGPVRRRQGPAVHRPGRKPRVLGRKGYNVKGTGKGEGKRNKSLGGWNARKNNREGSGAEGGVGRSNKAIPQTELGFNSTRWPLRLLRGSPASGLGRCLAGLHGGGVDDNCWERGPGYIASNL